MRAKKGALCSRGEGDRRGDPRDAAPAAQARSRVPVPVVRHGSCYWQFIALSIAKFTGQSSEDAVAWTGLVNGWYNIVTFSVAFALVAYARKRGAKVVHCVCLLLAAAGLTVFPFIDNKYLLFIPIIGLGIAWASIMGVPYIMAVRMIPLNPVRRLHGHHQHDDRRPMLIQSVTFGWIYEHVLGSNPNYAIVFAGVLLGLAALTMLWIKEPPIVRDVDEINYTPSAGH